MCIRDRGIVNAKGHNFMKNYWHINHAANISGTSLKLEIKAPREFIFETFGRPTWESRLSDVEEGNEKVLEEWVFENQEGRVVTLYDWKLSSLRDQWHIGAHDATTAHLFEIWLSELQKKEIEKRKVRLGL